MLIHLSPPLCEVCANDVPITHHKRRLKMRDVVCAIMHLCSHVCYVSIKSHKSGNCLPICVSAGVTRLDGMPAVNQSVVGCHGLSVGRLCVTRCVQVCQIMLRMARPSRTSRGHVQAFRDRWASLREGSKVWHGVAAPTEGHQTWRAIAAEIFAPGEI